MSNLLNLSSEKMYSSKFLVEQINLFREQEGNRSELKHFHFLAKVEKEFEEEIDEQIILAVSYKDQKGELRKCYEIPQYISKRLIDDYISFLKRSNKSNTKTYLMTDASGLVKIGRSKDLEKRISTIKTSNPTIRILATLDNNIENKLHKKYSNHNIIGEWFNLSNKQVNEIVTKNNFKLLSK